MFLYFFPRVATVSVESSWLRFPCCKYSSTQVNRISAAKNCLDAKDFGTKNLSTYRAMDKSESSLIRRLTMSSDSANASTGAPFCDASGFLLSRSGTGGTVVPALGELVQAPISCAPRQRARQSFADGGFGKKESLLLL